MNAKYQEEISNLKENISNLENHISRQEDLNSAFDIDLNANKNKSKGYTDEEIMDEMSKASIYAQEEQNKKEQIDKYEKMNNEVYTGEVLPVDSEEVKNAIDIDAEKSAKAYYEHKKKEEEINRLKAQRNMYVQMIPTENNNRSMGM